MHVVCCMWYVVCGVLYVLCAAVLSGKRLRHEKSRPVRVDRGGPNDFQMLSCYELQQPPAAGDPTAAVRKKIVSSLNI